MRSAAREAERCEVSRESGEAASEASTAVGWGGMWLSWNCLCPLTAGRPRPQSRRSTMLGSTRGALLVARGHSWSVAGGPGPLVERGWWSEGTRRAWLVAQACSWVRESRRDSNGCLTLRQPFMCTSRRRRCAALPAPWHPPKPPPHLNGPTPTTCSNLSTTADRRCPVGRPMSASPHSSPLQTSTHSIHPESPDLSAVRPEISARRCPDESGLRPGLPTTLPAPDGGTPGLQPPGIKTYINHP
jgi:hypothetical protein